VLTLEIAVFWNVTHVVWQLFTGISEECIASIIRVEENEYTYILEEFIACIFREEEQELVFCHEDEGYNVPSRHQ
jgi:hypothetical protein